jgi:hypothetical protein
MYILWRVTNLFDVLIWVVLIRVIVRIAVFRVTGQAARVSCRAYLAIAIQFFTVALILLVLMIKPIVHLFVLRSWLSEIIFGKNFVGSL